MPKTILFNADAAAKLKTGVDTVANAVRVTLGAKGRTVIIDNYNVPVVVTKDGVTCAKNIMLKDPVENTGANLLITVALKVLEISGDGTTTACVLAQAIFNEGMKLIAAGINPMELKKGIDCAVLEVVEQLKKQAIPVDDKKLVQVATVSANNDHEIGELVSKAYAKIGKDGIITIESSGSTTTEIKVVDGMQINKGWMSALYINNIKMTCEMKNVNILLYDRSITTAAEMEPVFHINGGQPLLIICDNMEGEAFATVNVNRVRSNLPWCVIHAPSYGEARKELLEDIAILTGANVISEQLGRELKKITAEDFGKCNGIICTQTTTTLVGGKGDAKRIKERITELRRFAEEPDTMEIDKTNLLQRAAKLSGGVAVMYVGGMSEVEMNEKKDRCDDAVRATKAALEEGIVSGGGIALLNCLATATGKRDFAAGVQLINDILSAPLRQMVINAGGDPGWIVGECLRVNLGYNVATDRFENLVETGIVDPLKVCRVALEQAASVAGTMLTSSVLMVEIVEPPPMQQQR